MIFSIDDHIKQIIHGTKTETRRPSDRYNKGRLYAVQPCRTCKGISEGKIFIGEKWREWKPYLSDIPEHAKFARDWMKLQAGYPIPPVHAQAEGGYTPFEYEEIYEEMYPDWQERWAYRFHFFTTKELEEIKK